MNEESQSVTYKAMLDEVEAIVKEVSSEGLDLDLMVQKIERGYSLIKAMRKRLAETKTKVETLRLEFE